MNAPRLLLLDCDSTLSSIEGIDELGRLRGEATFAEIEAMTTAAMEGRIPVESVFGRRLEIIRPEAGHIAEVGRRYLATVEPTAKATLDELRARGWTPVILSGGFRNVIRPLADFLGVERIEAVDLYQGPDGAYAGYDVAYPTTRSGGKPEIIQRLRTELAPRTVVMVGDGVSDLETKPVVDLFVGLGRYVTRERVRREAQHFIHSLAELPPLLARWG
ncbi:MAG: HAD-IB family phosphatase [Verrucomicrobia bacterium]|nr:HAD-IB family phosphatase [Verrucomicrobiota bacterium]